MRLALYDFNAIIADAARQPAGVVDATAPIASRVKNSAILERPQLVGAFLHLSQSRVERQ